MEEVPPLLQAILKARGIVFDLRVRNLQPEPTQMIMANLFQIMGIDSLLTSLPLNMPSGRSRMYQGFPPQDGSPSLYSSAFYVEDRGGSPGFYTSAFFLQDGGRTSSGRYVKDIPVVFLANGFTTLPKATISFQTTGKWSIVGEGSVSEGWAVSTEEMMLPDSVAVVIRTGELVYPDGTGFQPDAIVPFSPVPGDRNPAFQKALALVRQFRTTPKNSKPPLPSGRSFLDRSYPEMRYPPVAYRVLAACRIWTIIHYFYPYKDLMGEDWDAVLREFIPKMEQAKDALAYHLAVAEMMARIHDSHGIVQSPVLQEHFGAIPPIRIRMIEGVPVITGYRDSVAAKACGLEIGDVILKVDGKDAGARMARYRKYIAGSTSQAILRNGCDLRNPAGVWPSLVSGPENSTITLTLRDRNNRQKVVKVQRKSEYVQQVSQRIGDTLRVLHGNIGYVDLERLATEMIDGMFEKFKDTKAILFDMRGYPPGKTSVIATRLTERKDVSAVQFQLPVVMTPEAQRVQYLSPSVAYSLVLTFPHTDLWRYKGKTVMLIDERTQSAAEHTGLFLEAANGTKFIGSPTSGADGSVTKFFAPGGILCSFTGMSVRHADGRQLQRVGLQPDIKIKPTIKGIQEGRDEVLEGAVKYLEENGK
jgi:C-terminal processing protease CtpA/Prc